MRYVVSHERSGTHRTIDNIAANVAESIDLWNLGGWRGPYHDPACREHRFNRWGKNARGKALVKTHADPALFSRFAPPDACVLYVVRDPRDAMVSWWHYLNDPRAGHRGGIDHACPSVADFLRRPCSEFLRHSYALNPTFRNVVERWAHHVSAWRCRGVSFVRFEDWDRDHAMALAKCTAVLGLTSVGTPQPVGLHDGNAVMPREGIIGDWRNHLTDADEAFIREIVSRYQLQWTLWGDASSKAS